MASLYASYCVADMTYQLLPLRAATGGLEVYDDCILLIALVGPQSHDVEGGRAHVEVQRMKAEGLMMRRESFCGTGAVCVGRR